MSVLHALDPEDRADEDGATNTIFTFDYQWRIFEVDHQDGDDTYALYEEGDLVLYFHYWGDPEDHYNIEDAAIAALEEQEKL